MNGIGWMMVAKTLFPDLVDRVPANVTVKQDPVSSTFWRMEGDNQALLQAAAGLLLQLESKRFMHSRDGEEVSRLTQEVSRLTTELEALHVVFRGLQAEHQDLLRDHLALSAPVSGDPQPVLLFFDYFKKLSKDGLLRFCRFLGLQQDMDRKVMESRIEERLLGLVTQSTDALPLQAELVSLRHRHARLRKAVREMLSVGREELGKALTEDDEEAGVVDASMGLLPMVGEEEGGKSNGDGG